MASRNGGAASNTNTANEGATANAEPSANSPTLGQTSLSDSDFETLELTPPQMRSVDLGAISADTASIKDFIQTSLAKFRDELTSRLDHRYEALKSEIFALTEDNSALRHEISDQKATITELKGKLVVQEKLTQTAIQDIEQLEMYSRRNNIRVYGIQETEKEDCERVFVDLYKQRLKLDVPRGEICRAHRIGRVTNDPRRPRPIIVKLIRHNIESAVIRQRRELKGTRIVIREDLTAYSEVLSLGVRPVWSMDGRITALYNDTKHQIRDRSDIAALRAQITSGD